MLVASQTPAERLDFRIQHDPLLAVIDLRMHEYLILLYRLPVAGRYLLYAPWFFRTVLRMAANEIFGRIYGFYISDDHSYLPFWNRIS